MFRPRLVAGIIVLAVVVGTSTAYAASLALASSRVTVYAQCLARAAADASVFEDSGSNQGTASELFVRSQSAAKNARALVRFDLAPCGLSSSSQITSATLQLFMSAAPSATRTYEAHRLTAAWGEATVIWTNQPAAAATATASTATGTTSNVWLSWTVTTDVSAYASGSASNNGWRIRDLVESSTDLRESKSNAREHGNSNQRPRLTINYYP